MTKRSPFKLPGVKIDPRKLGLPVYWSQTLGKFVTIPRIRKDRAMTTFEFQAQLYRTSREMHTAIAEAWLSGGDTRESMLAALADYTNETAAREAIEDWELAEHPDFNEAELVDAFRDIRANFDTHFPPEHGFRLGARVEGGKGDDHDTGEVIGIIDPPQGECDLMIAWASGVSTPAISSELTLMNGGSP